MSEVKSMTGNMDSLQRKDNKRGEPYLSLKVGGEFYNFFSKDADTINESEDTLERFKGKKIKFSYTQSGKFRNIQAFDVDFLTAKKLHEDEGDPAIATGTREEKVEDDTAREEAQQEHIEGKFVVLYNRPLMQKCLTEALEDVYAVLMKTKIDDGEVFPPEVKAKIVESMYKVGISYYIEQGKKEYWNKQTRS